MQLDDQAIALNAALNECLGRDNSNALAMYILPFDTKPVNEHGSKGEFNRELSMVQNSLKHACGLRDELVGDASDDPLDKDIRDRLGEKLNSLALSYNKSESLAHTLDLLINNARLIGLRYSLAFVLFDLIEALATRHKELKDQEKEFWTVASRPPNYYARTIALRVARVYAGEKGEHPTYGSARDGGHPSTSYGRALERIFEILGIEAGIRGPAEWAIQQLTDEDLKQPAQGGLASLMGIGSPQPEKTGISKVAEALMKRHQ